MSLLEYSGLTAKVRAMSGKLITKADYKNLEALTSVDEFAAYLGDTKEYGELFSKYDTHSLHRDNIEELLRLSSYENFTRLYAFSGKTQRRFLDLYVIRYEVSILKTLLRHLYNPDTVNTDISLFRDFFLKFSGIDIVLLNDCASFSELIDNLYGSRFYNVLKKVEALENPTLFDYEMQLDLYYFTQIWKYKDKYIKGQDLQIVTNNYGQKIDWLNIRWIYRSKRFYHLTPDKIYNLIIPVNHKLKRQELSKLVNAESLEDFYAVLAKTCYGNKLSQLKDTHLEDIYFKVQEQINTSDSKKNPYSVAIIDYYLYRKEQEIRKLTVLLECIRYGLDNTNIDRYLENS